MSLEVERTNRESINDSQLTDPVPQNVPPTPPPRPLFETDSTHPPEVERTHRESIRDSQLTDPVPPNPPSTPPPRLLPETVSTHPPEVDSHVSCLTDNPTSDSQADHHYYSIDDLYDGPNVFELSPYRLFTTNN